MKATLIFALFSGSRWRGWCGPRSRRFARASSSRPRSPSAPRIAGSSSATCCRTGAARSSSPRPPCSARCSCSKPRSSSSASASRRPIQPTLGNLIGDAQTGSLAFGLGWWTLVVPAGVLLLILVCVNLSRRRPRRCASSRASVARRVRAAVADAPGRNRTCDLALRRRALYPLSYWRRGEASLPAVGRWYVPAVDVSARIVTLELAETFVISRSARDSEDVVVVELRHSGVSGFGEAQPVDRYERVGRVGAGVRRGARGAAGRRPVRARGGDGAAAGARVRRARGDRRRAPRPAGQAPRPARLAAARPPPRRPADELDGLARRSRRHGSPRREGARPLPAPQAQARRPRRARRRARPRGARRRRRPAAAGRRQRGVEPRRGARGAARARRARRRVLRAAAARRRPGRPRAEGALARPDLRRRGLPRARATSRRARSAPTGSTSSSRSRAGSARRCGWCTPPARSGSAACSAA